MKNDNGKDSALENCLGEMKQYLKAWSVLSERQEELPVEKEKETDNLDMLSCPSFFTGALIIECIF